MHSYGINLLIYIIMLLTGFMGASIEISRNKRHVLHLLLFLVLFYLAAVSRIGHAYDYSDFGHYIDYFMDDNDAYFEPGYVYITQFIKGHLGYKPIYLVSSFIILVLLCVFITEWQLHKQYYLYKKEDEKYSFRYIFTYLSIWSVYNGFAACSESLRPGLSSTILVISMVFALNRKWIPSIIFMLLSATVHVQSLISLPGLVFLMLIDSIPIKFLKIWFGLIVLLGIIIGLFKIFDFSLLGYIINLLDTHGDASHYEAYMLATEGAFLSTQWVTKHLIAFLLLFGNHQNILYNRAVVLYYFGLSIGAVMSASSIFLRFEGIYLPAFIIAFYYFLRDHKFSKARRISMLALFLPYYGIMLLRWLGWYI